MFKGKLNKRRVFAVRDQRKFLSGSEDYIVARNLTRQEADYVVTKTGNMYVEIGDNIVPAFNVIYLPQG